MNYEVLVLVGTGEIVSVYPKGHEWKSGEKENIFIVVPFKGETKDTEELLSKSYVYDGKEFVHNNTGVVFEGAYTKQDAPPFQPVINDIAATLDPKWHEKCNNVCDFFQPSYLTETDQNYRNTRRYWFDKFYKFKDIKGMKEFLSAMLHRDYGNIVNASRELPISLQETFVNDDIFTNDDKKWLKLMMWGERGDNSN